MGLEATSTKFSNWGRFRWRRGRLLESNRPDVAWLLFLVFLWLKMAVRPWEMEILLALSQLEGLGTGRAKQREGQRKGIQLPTQREFWLFWRTRGGLPAFLALFGEGASKSSSPCMAADKRVVRGSGLGLGFRRKKSNGIVRLQSRSQ